MNYLPTRLAILASAAVMTVAAPAFAAPPAGGYGPGGSGSNNVRIDCTLPENANLPFCVRLKARQGGQTTTNGNGSTTTTTNGSNNNGPANNNGPGTNNGPNNGPNAGGPGPRPGTFDWSRRDRDQFHQRFRGFDFGVFPIPSFSIHVGAHVPRSFHLRTVPRSIYRFYPWFRGYLYFVTRRGDFVIVSPRSYRVVAVL